jgi:hypothetical protein
MLFFTSLFSPARPKSSILSLMPVLTQLLSPGLLQRKPLTSSSPLLFCNPFPHHWCFWFLHGCCLAATFKGLLATIGLLLPQNPITQTLIENFWLPTWLCVTSILPLRVILSHSSLTINLLSLPFLSLVLTFSSHQQCHLSFLSEFTTMFSHLPGPQNIVANALSHPPFTSLPVTLATTMSPSFLPLSHLLWSHGQGTTAMFLHSSSQTTFLSQHTSVLLPPQPAFSWWHFHQNLPTTHFSSLPQINFPQYHFPWTPWYLSLLLAYHCQLLMGWDGQGDQYLDKKVHFLSKLPKLTPASPLHPPSFLFLLAAFHISMLTLLARFSPLADTHTSLQSLAAPQHHTQGWGCTSSIHFRHFFSSSYDRTNLSPAKAVYGSPLVLPAQVPLSPEDDSSQFPLQLCHRHSCCSPSVFSFFFLRASPSNPLPLNPPIMAQEKSPPMFSPFLPPPNRHANQLCFHSSPLTSSPST